MTRKNSNNANNCHIIDGKSCANKLLCDAANNVLKLSTKYNIIPKLDIVLIGSNPASRTYVNMKMKRATEIGINVALHHLSCDETQYNIEKLVYDLSNSKDVNGIIVQLPLPKHLNQRSIIDVIHHKKDVDGLTTHNAGMLYSGAQTLTPCTARGILHLITDAMNGYRHGAKAVVVGRSMIVGKPTAMLLLQENYTVTIAHSHTINVQKECAMADILVVGIGRSNFVKGSWIKEGACVIDVGINKDDNGVICGDVDFEEAQRVAGYLTPVPGGVGPMTVAYLLINTIEATCMQYAIDINSI